MGEQMGNGQTTLNKSSLPTLYKMASTGATQEWNISVQANPDATATIKVTYGQKDGKMQTTETVVKAGKNLGRANATDSFYQAKAESISKWNRQKDKGYGESVDVAKPKRKPMLAQDYRKHKDKINFPCQIQPKLDGIRCLAHKEGKYIKLVSRMGKPIDTVIHINESLINVMQDGETWDGELFIKSVPFQTLASWIKRKQDNSFNVQYHVYDAITNEDFRTRYGNVYKRIRKEFPKPSETHIKAVPTFSAESHDDIKTLHDQFVKDGYEGGIARVNGCPYKEGYRSQDLLKVKEFIDEEFEIVGASEGKGKFEGMAVFRLKTKEGAEFDCLPEGTEEVRRAYWDNKESAIGKMMTVRFFEWTTSTNPLPRFPIGVAIRDYE